MRSLVFILGEILSIKDDGLLSQNLFNADFLKMKDVYHKLLSENWMASHWMPIINGATELLN